MSIYQQVDDASFLAQNGRDLGALTLLLIAIASSSRKLFPKGTKSLKDPKKEMGDEEAFTQFLGGRIRTLLFGSYGAPEFGNSGISLNFRGKDFDLAYILYKFYRCELVHEGDLPKDVEFKSNSTSTGIALSRSSLGPSVSIGSGDKMVLDHGWIDLLISAVRQARCNGVEFGIEHFDLFPLPGVDEATHSANIIANYSISPGCYQILKQAVQLISPEVIKAAEDRQLVDHFSQLVISQEINGGAITGLACRGLTNHLGQLQAKGIAALREVGAAYALVKV